MHIKFLPEKYNYRRNIDVDPESGQDRECVICMNTVTASNRDYMITPCNHVYHDTCLRQVSSSFSAHTAMKLTRLASVDGLQDGVPHLQRSASLSMMVCG